MGNRFGKGKGNDATQDVSLSQFVPPKPPASLTKPPTISRGGQKNDMSLWGGVVVGTSDFSPPAPRQRRSNAWKWIAGGAAVVAAGVAAFFLVSDAAPMKKPEPPPAPVASVAPVEKPPEPKPAPVVVPDKPRDAAPPAVAAALPTTVDAVSGVAPIIKPKPVAKKKKPTRKTAVKKKIVRMTKKVRLVLVITSPRSVYRRRRRRSPHDLAVPRAEVELAFLPGGLRVLRVAASV